MLAIDHGDNAKRAIPDQTLFVNSDKEAISITVGATKVPFLQCSGNSKTVEGILLLPRI